MNLMESLRQVVSQKDGETDDLQAPNVQVNMIIAATGIVNIFIFIGFVQNKNSQWTQYLKNLLPVSQRHLTRLQTIGLPVSAMTLKFSLTFDE
jgi:hypothetical protein